MFYELGNALSSMGASVQYDDVAIVNYYALHPRFVVQNINVKYGDKYEKSSYLIQNLLLDLDVVKYLAKFEIKDDIKKLLVRDGFSDQESVYQFNEGIIWESNLHNYLSVILTNNLNVIDFIENIHVVNKGFAFYQLDAEKNRNLILQSSSNDFYIDLREGSATIENSLQDNSLTTASVIALRLEGYQYNANSSDNIIKILSRLGNINININLLYSNIPNIASVRERFSLQKSGIYNDAFSIVLNSGKKIINNDDAHSVVNVRVNNYQKLLDLQCEIFNETIKHIKKSHASYNAINPLDASQERQLRDLILSLSLEKNYQQPFTGKDINIEVVTHNQELTIGGMSFSTLQQKLGKVFLKMDFNR